MVDYIVSAVVILVAGAIIYPLLKSYLLRRKIRSVILENRNSIQLLKRNARKNPHHALARSLYDKVMLRLENQYGFYGKKYEKIVTQEILKIIRYRGAHFWGLVKTTLQFALSGLVTIFMVFFIIGMLSDETKESSPVIKTASTETAADEQMANEKLFQQANTYLVAGNLKDALTSFKQISKNYERYSEVKEKIEKIENEQYFNAAYTYESQGNLEKAIASYNKITKNFEGYDEVQQTVEALEFKHEISQYQSVDYKVIKKNGGKFVGKKLFFSGEIFNIQEMNNKTFMVIPTKYNDYYGGYSGDDIIVYYDGIVNLFEGDYVEIHGIMQGDYDQAFNSKVMKFFGTNSLNFQYSGDTFINQAPVLEAKYVNVLEK